MSQLYDAARNAYWRVRGLPLVLPSLVMRGHTDLIRSVAFLPDGQQMISGSNDRTIRAWRLGDDTGAVETVTVMEEGGVVVAVAVSSDGQWIATGGEDRTITIWNATTHEKAIELRGHLDWVRSLAFSPDSARVVSGSDDWMVVVWSATTGEQLAGPLEGHTSKVYSVAFAPDGDRIASCNGDDIRVWHSYTGELIDIIYCVGHPRSLEWTPDDQKLIAGCKDGSINVIHAANGLPFAEWDGHASVVCSISVSPDGKFFASGSWDKTVRLWDTTTQQQIGPTLQHDGEINSVAISPDGRHLASGGDDRQVRIWSLQPIVPKSLLKNTNTSITSDDAPTDVGMELSSQLGRDPLQEAPDTRNAKDEDVEKTGNLEGVESTLQRRPSESSSLRDFLDGPAIAPIGGAADLSDQLYDNFFNNDSTDVPHLVDGPPKKRFTKFLNKFTQKQNLQGRGVETQTQPQPQQAGAGAEAEPAVDPLSTTTPKELTSKDKGKQKEIDPDVAPAEESDCAAIPTAGPKPAPSAVHSKHKARGRVSRIRQAITRRRNESAAQKHDHLKVIPIACGHMDERVATAKAIPRKRWKGNLKKKDENAHAAEPSTVATTSQQEGNDSNKSDADEAVLSDDEEVAASWCEVLLNLICYCSRDRYISVDDPD